jgi:hypothetical protein
MDDPNWLTLFGAVLGLIGSALLSIDALGAPDFLAALKSDREITRRMTELGFKALINRIVIYLTISLVSFLTILVLTGGRIVFASVLAPWPYFPWRLVCWFTLWLERKLRKLGPRPARTFRRSKTPWGRAVNWFHLLSWLFVYLIVTPTAIFINYLMTLPITAISELVTVPLVARLYTLSARVVAGEKKWHLKANALVGSLLILFGFLYQFVATVMVMLAGN